MCSEKKTWRFIHSIKNFNEEEEIMNISSKKTMRTLAVGVVAISISSLGSWTFAVSAPTPSVCTSAYMAAGTVTGENLSKVLDGCYVNAPATANTTSCVQNAFKAHYRVLLAAINNFQRCSATS